jgi:hypothetical protein
MDIFELHENLNGRPYIFERRKCNYVKVCTVKPVDFFLK